MTRRARFNAVSLVVIIPVLSAGVGAAQVEPSEGERREVSWQARDQRIAEEYGTRDLRDLYLRAARIGSQEIERSRLRLSGAGPLAVPVWTSLGPLFSPTYTAPVGTALAGHDDTGLTTAVAPHPSDPKTILVGAAGGGVWKTADGGATWRAVTDSVGVLQIGAVAYAPSQPNRVYAGTGCGDSSTSKIGSAGGVKVGVGVLISNDGGEAWRVSNTSPGAYFWALSVDPANPDIVLAATDQGVQRSTDGGDTWAGIVTTVSDNPIYATSLSRSTATPAVVYASIYRPGQVAGGVVQSTDRGATFAQKSEGLPGDAERRGRVQVAVAPGDATRVYALVAFLDGTQADGARSTDGGTTWTALGLNGKMVNILSMQGFFASVISVSPTNPDTLYAGGLDLWRSTNAGDTWTQLSDWSPPTTPPRPITYLHSDQHVIVFGSTGTVYVGNDGGLYSFSEETKTFTGINRGVLSYLVDDVCASPSGDVILAGAQDNGTAMRTPGSSDWAQVGGADGYACAVNRTNGMIITVTSQNQGIERSMDGGKTFAPAQGLTEAGGNNAKFRTILRSHPTEAGRLFTATKKKIWQSDDNGATWTEVSKMMPLIGDIGDFTVSPADGNRLVLVDDNRHVVESTNGGNAWTKMGEYPGPGHAVAIRLDKNDAAKIYVASNDSKTGRERVWLSTDRGATWVAISRTGQSDGLPDLPVWTIEVDPRDSKVLWAGTFIGLYRSGDSGQTWQRFGMGLPNVPVPDIVFASDGTVIIAGTAGKGIWQTSANVSVAPQGGIGATSTAPPTVDFSYDPSNPQPGHTVTFTDQTLGGPTSWSWDFGDGSRSTHESATHVYTAPGSFNVTLSATNAGGTASKTKTVSVANATTGMGDAFTYLLPVVLTSAGAGGTNFSTELTMANRSGGVLNLTFKAKGTFEASSTYSMSPGQEIYGDIFTFLKTSTGLPVPGGNVVTSLRIEVRGADNLGQFGAQVRVTTPPNADQMAQGIGGRFGLALQASPLGTGASKQAIVYGLAQTSNVGQPGTRSNLACVHAGGGSGGQLQLEVTYVNGDTGLSHSSKDSFNLSAFQFDQKGQPLAARGIKYGYAKITRVSGDDQFICYGVLNDNLNGDGSFVPMVLADTASAVHESLIPVIVGTDTFHSEMTVANRSPYHLAAEFALIPFNTAVPEFGDFELEAGQQVTFADIVSDLRNAGFNAPPGTVASLYFQFEQSSVGPGKTEGETQYIGVDKAYVGVRTYASKNGGLFGLAYGASPVGGGADTEAYVYGLQQTGVRGQSGTRANLAVVHALGGELEPLGLEVTYFGPDSAELGKDPDCSPCQLQPGQWKQFNGPLSRYGVPHGYARIRRVSGSDQFLAYGVLNDQVNDDGSYVPMIVP